VTLLKTIPAENLHLLLDDLDGMKITVSRGFNRGMARVYFKRKHMKQLLYKDTARYYRTDASRS
jgi:hypothetical protein